MKRRVIGHAKAEHRMDRNHLKGRVADRINAVPAADGFSGSAAAAGNRLVGGSSPG